MKPTKTYLRPASLALIFGLGTIAAGAAYAQGAGNTNAPRDGKRFERMAERMKDRCEKFEARLADMDKKLTADQARDIVAGRLAERGNPNLKVGKVKQTGDVVSIEIVTAKGDSLVTTREISTKTGLPPQAAERCDKMEERIEKAREQRADGDGRRHRGEHRRGGRDGFGRDGFGGGLGFGGLGLAAGTNRDLNLTSDQVKKLVEARLIMLGNPRLKVGAVKEQDADTYAVDIVTLDNALVDQRLIDKDTGRTKRN